VRVKSTESGKTQGINHAGKDARIEEARHTMKEVGQAVQNVS
jgi:hypothetical protein